LDVRAKLKEAALSAGDLKELRSRVSVVAPPAGLEPATGWLTAVSFIEGSIPVPGRFLLSHPGRALRMRRRNGQSTNRIVRRLGVSDGAVVAALGNLRIAASADQDEILCPDQLLSGGCVQNGRLDHDNTGSAGCASLMQVGLR